MVQVAVQTVTVVTPMFQRVMKAVVKCNGHFVPRTLRGDKLSQLQSEIPHSKKVVYDVTL